MQFIEKIIQTYFNSSTFEVFFIVFLIVAFFAPFVIAKIWFEPIIKKDMEELRKIKAKLYEDLEIAEQEGDFDKYGEILLEIKAMETPFNFPGPFIMFP